MASNPPQAPVLFDRSLLHVRQNRALRGGAATFLLDTVAEDLAGRLNAVLREFSDVADVWTPGEILAKALRQRFKSVAHIGLQQPDERLAL